LGRRDGNNNRDNLGVGEPLLLPDYRVPLLQRILDRIAQTFSQMGCALGFLFSVPILFVLAPGDLPGLYWREGLLSLFIFLAVPSRLLAKLPLKLQKLRKGANSAAEDQSRRLVAERIKRFAALFQEMFLGFVQAAAAQHRRNEEELSPLLEELMNRVCRSCLYRRRCWEKELFSHHRMILDLLARVDTEGEVNAAHLSPAFRARCGQPEALIRAINNLHEVWQLNRFWEQKVKERKDLVSGQLEGLARIMLDLAAEVDENRFSPGVDGQAPLFFPEIGLAQRAGRNQPVCGDYYTLLEPDCREHVIILSDGMGNGPRAALESKATVTMLERMLEAGFHKEVVLRSVNSLLQLRSGEEIFATVDMALINLVEGEVELLKIGAAPSFLKRGKEVFKVGASSLPIGILTNIEMECFKEKLQVNDLLVMVTDGVCDPDGDIGWIVSFLRQMENSPPQIVADRILHEAARRSGSYLRDDLTVITCRLLRLKQRGK